MLAFFKSHTPDTIEERYGFHPSMMDAERARSLVGIDQTRDCAFGIFEPGLGGEILDAVGRYCLDADGQSAEIALVVRESDRRQGFGSVLLQELIKTAKVRHLRSLWAQVSVLNAAMTSLLQQHDFDPGPFENDGVIRYSLDITCRENPAIAEAD